MITYRFAKGTWFKLTGISRFSVGAVQVNSTTGLSLTAPCAPKRVESMGKAHRFNENLEADVLEFSLLWPDFDAFRS